MNLGKKIQSSIIKLIHIKDSFDDNKVIAHWSSNENTLYNWGDALNPWLLEKILNKKIVNYKNTLNLTNKPVLVFMGSILDKKIKSKRTVICGAGFRNSNSNLKFIPSKILSVRGPLTRVKILEAGFECPEIYGDPALIFSKYYNPIMKLEYDLGIIPHYQDNNIKSVNKLKMKKNVNYIDINSGIINVAKEIKKCKNIVSSSLHGLILSDSYAIPNKWFEPPNCTRDRYKYNDYYMSLGENDEKPIIFNDAINEIKLLDCVKCNSLSNINIVNNVNMIKSVIL